ncbi:MAG TPA: CDP-alcohol phosphatidyltransferase family protein [Bacilli bacterium]|nr:CDP-alcohol phosphatidyltransferase family protein [Bacilli bacterium]
MRENKFKKKIKENWNFFITEGKKCLKEFMNKKTRIKQIPNILTASRLLSPFFIIPAALFNNIILLAIFTIIFAITDGLDGYFARKLNASSEFGRRIDPITDKVFAFSLLIPLMFYYKLIIIVFILEIIIALINTYSQFNNNLPKTSFNGKIKTTILYVSIAICYCSIEIPINYTIKKG